MYVAILEKSHFNLYSYDYVVLGYNCGDFVILN